MTPNTTEAQRHLDLYKIASSDWNDENGVIDMAKQDIMLALSEMKSTTVKALAWTGGAGDVMSLAVLEYADGSGIAIVMANERMTFNAGNAAWQKKKGARLARKHGLQRAAKGWDFNFGSSCDRSGMRGRWDRPKGFSKMRRKGT